MQRAVALQATVAGCVRKTGMAVLRTPAMEVSWLFLHFGSWFQAISDLLLRRSELLNLWHEVNEMTSYLLPTMTHYENDY